MQIKKFSNVWISVVFQRSVQYINLWISAVYQSLDICTLFNGLQSSKTSEILVIIKISRDLHALQTIEGDTDTQRFLDADTQRSAYKKISWCCWWCLLQDWVTKFDTLFSTSAIITNIAYLHFFSPFTLFQNFYLLCLNHLVYFIMFKKNQKGKGKAVIQHH